MPLSHIARADGASRVHPTKRRCSAPAGAHGMSSEACMAAADIVAGDGDAEDLAYEIYWHAAYSQLPELRPVAGRFLELYVGWGPAFDQTEEAIAAAKVAAQSFLRDHPA